MKYGVDDMCDGGDSSGATEPLETRRRTCVRDASCLTLLSADESDRKMEHHVSSKGYGDDSYLVGISSTPASSIEEVFVLSTDAKTAWPSMSYVPAPTRRRGIIAACERSGTGWSA